MALSPAALVYLTSLLQAACAGVTGTDGTSIWYAPGTTCQAASATALSAFDPTQPVPVTGGLSTKDFFSRFTSGEMAAIWHAAAADPTGLLGAGLLQVQAAGQVDLHAPSLQNWLSALSVAGVITQGRATVIVQPIMTSGQTSQGSGPMLGPQP